jgi:DNA-binding MarR family transcriptional regulator/GNAT superfamily N-acetyltransferase
MSALHPEPKPIVSSQKPAPETSPRNVFPGEALHTESVRRFSRFYTRHIGVLQEEFLDSPYSLTEGRVIYELAHREETTATDLGQELGLDAGYLSRILRSFGRRGLVKKRRSSADRRRQMLSLTAEGQAAFARLNAASRNQIEAMLAELSEDDQGRLVQAMGTIESLLGAQPEQRVPYILRPHQSGDMGWVLQRHAVLYRQEYGWDESMEALAAEVVAHFLRHFDAKLERCWIAEKDGENVGSVAVVKNRDRAGVAQLRLLLVEPKARGLGIGRRLVHECTRFARQAGYHTIVLWTDSVLGSARRLYEDEGYHMVSEEPNESFGEGTAQVWELSL